MQNCRMWNSRVRSASPSAPTPPSSCRLCTPPQARYVPLPPAFIPYGSVGRFLLNSSSPTHRRTQSHASSQALPSMKFKTNTTMRLQHDTTPKHKCMRAPATDKFFSLEMASRMPFGTGPSLPMLTCAAPNYDRTRHNAASAAHIFEHSRLEAAPPPRTRLLCVLGPVVRPSMATCACIPWRRVAAVTHTCILRPLSPTVAPFPLCKCVADCGPQRKGPLTEQTRMQICEKKVISGGFRTANVHRGAPHAPRSHARA